MIILISLAVWRLVYMLQNDAGPFNIFSKLRDKLPDNNFTEGFECVNCQSIWWAMLFAIPISSNVWEWFVNLLAISAVVMLLSGLSSRLQS